MGSTSKGYGFAAQALGTRIKPASHKPTASTAEEPDFGNKPVPALLNDRPGRYTVEVKVIDIFGNDTMTLVPVNVG